MGPIALVLGEEPPPEAGGCRQGGFLVATILREHPVSKGSLPAQVPYSWDISSPPSARAAGHSHSRRHAGRGPGVHKFGWGIHSGDKNKLGQHFPPHESPRACAQVPWWSPTCSLRRQVELLLHPGLLQH